MLIKRLLLYSPQGLVTKASDNGGVPINGQTKDGQSGATAAGLACQAPLIDDSLIAADDDMGFPLISAVYSLAANGNQQNGEQSIVYPSKTGSPQIINLGKAVSPASSFVINEGNLPSSESIRAKLSNGIPSSAFQNKLTPSIQNIVSASVGSNTLQNTLVKSPSETTRSEGILTPESHERKTSPQAPDVRARPQPTLSSTGANLHSSGNVLQLVKLVDSVPKQGAQTVHLLKTTTDNPAKPVTQLPRHIAMKQPGTTSSIVLNLKPGEPLPKAIKLLGPDGKSVVVLSLTDGGKPLASPVTQTGGKIFIPISPSISSSLASKQVNFVNTVVNVSSGQVPIAPHPGRTTVLSPTGISAPVLLSVSDSSALQKPLVVSTVVGATRTSVAGSVSNTPETRLPVIVRSSTVPSTTLGSRDSLSTSTATLPTTITPSEAKPSTSSVDKQTGLSPQEARIQRLKELIKTQEDAVNKLRENRRLEIERIRDPSLISKPDNEDNALQPERVPLAEQKRSSSPFAVPLPPKKRSKEQDASFKTKVSKPNDPSVTQGEGAFIPNGDDKSFVQLVGLENVVKNIK